MADPKDKAHRKDGDKKKEPTAGPDYDDRGPDPQHDQEAALRAANIQLAKDRNVRILGVSVHGNGTEILLGSGFKQGVTEEMEGYIAGEHGPYADFKITHVDDVTSKAFIEATPDEIRANMNQVVINPSQKVQATLAPDTKTRIMAISVEGAKTRIKIARGRMQGVNWGDFGVVLSSGGTKLAHFVIDDVNPRISAALVDLIPDQLRDVQIVLKPTAH
jgi:hypothetical protein